MILLPLPITLALILGFLALRMALGLRPVPLLAALLALLALQALVNALALHYAVPLARFVQPVTAMAVPALAWLAWHLDAQGLRLDWRDLAHGIGPLAALALRYENSLILELLVPLVYAAYGAALAIALWRSGPDLPRAKMGQGERPRLVWAGIAAALILSAVSDFAIAALFAMGRGALVPQLVDVATTALLMGLGALAVTAQQMTGDGGEGTTEGSEPVSLSLAPSEDDHALFARLQALMIERKLWRDPDVTLSMLARRLLVPVKSLSQSVNRVTGQNISRYVNQHRIDAAATALRGGASVTEAMFEAGFVTKSNFNREFRRITGQAPSDIVGGHKAS